MTTSVQNPAATCWACGAAQPAAAPFCGSCGKVQPVGKSDYFAAFSLPNKLVIDAPALEKQFYKLSRKLHPDLYGQASAEEQAASLAQSSLVNDAYRTLKNPVARVEYLLELRGYRINENNAAQKSDAPRVPADLLEEVFELNMQLEEMKANKKMGEDDPQLRADLENAQARFTTQLSEVDEQVAETGRAWDDALDRDDAGAQTAVAKDLSALLDRRGYLRNLVRDVNETLEPA